MNEFVTSDDKKKSSTRMSAPSRHHPRQSRHHREVLQLLHRSWSVMSLGHSWIRSPG